jgi:hypothetical protein
MAVDTQFHRDDGWRVSDERRENIEWRKGSGSSAAERAVCDRESAALGTSDCPPSSSAAVSSWRERSIATCSFAARTSASSLAWSLAGPESAILTCGIRGEPSPLPPRSTVIASERGVLDGEPAALSKLCAAVIDAAESGARDVELAIGRGAGREAATH